MRRAQKLQKPIPKPRGNKHNRCNIVDLRGREEGEDIFVIGTGTSLRGFRFEILNRKVTIALNDAVKVPGFCPNYHIFSDVGIWTRYRLLDLDKRTIVVCQRRARDQFIRFEKCKFKEQVYHFNQVGEIHGIKIPGDFYISRTVATGGIMLAALLGAKRIFLMGVDGYKVVESETGEEYYYHDESRKKEKRKQRGGEFIRLSNGSPAQQILQDRHDWWKKNMRELQGFYKKEKLYQEKYPGSGIFNLSGYSSIDAWQKVKIKTVLGFKRKLWNF